jgi:hypothetical protein
MKMPCGTYRCIFRRCLRYWLAALLRRGTYPGLDQVSLELPYSLAGSGTVNVVITAEGQTANIVSMVIE